jgi:hypothetical protein
MPAPFTIPGEVFEEQWPTVVARVVKADNSLIVQADVTAGTASAGTGIDLYVYNHPSLTPTTAIYSALGGTVSSFIYDTLQTDGYWEGEDETGYNFRHTLDMTGAGLVADAGEKCWLKYRINMASGGPIFVIAEITWRGVMAT